MEKVDGDGGDEDVWSDVKNSVKKSTHIRRDEGRKRRRKKGTEVNLIWESVERMKKKVGQDGGEDIVEEGGWSVSEKSFINTRQKLFTITYFL